MKTTLETVTPEIASKYLESNTENRPLRRSWVESLVGMMRRGQWQTTHQGIAFDVKGRLIDGQHRLHAIREFGKPIEVLVTRGLDDNVYRSVDAGRTRTLGDRLKLLSDPRANQVACSLVRAYVFAAQAAIHAAPVDLIDNCFLSMSDEFTEVAERFKCKVPSLTRSDVGAAIVCYLSEHPEQAREFLDGYIDGEGLSAGSPVKMLREALFMKRIATSRVHEGYWKTIYCTRMHQEGRPIASVQAATTDWKGNRYDRLHYEKLRMVAKGVETRKRDEILGSANGKRRAVAAR